MSKYFSALIILLFFSCRRENISSQDDPVYMGHYYSKLITGQWCDTTVTHKTIQLSSLGGVSIEIPKFYNLNLKDSGIVLLSMFQKKNPKSYTAVLISKCRKADYDQLPISPLDNFGTPIKGDTKISNLDATWLIWKLNTPKNTFRILSYQIPVDSEIVLINYMARDSNFSQQICSFVQMTKSFKCNNKSTYVPKLAGKLESKSFEKEPNYNTKKYNSEFEELILQSISSSIKDGEVKELYSSGIKYYLGKDFRKAETTFFKALAIEPNNKILLYFLGNIEEQLLNYGGAISCYKKAIAIDEKFLFPYLSLSSSYLKMSQFQYGHEACDYAIKNGHGSFIIGTAIYYKAMLFLKQNKCVEAKTSWGSAKNELGGCISKEMILFEKSLSTSCPWNKVREELFRLANHLDK